MDNITFSPCLPTNAIILFATALAFVIPFVFLYLRPLWRVSNRIQRESETGPAPDSACAPVSVIVYTRDEAEALSRLLPTILSQRYDGPFEVIVVNEGQSDATSTVVERLRLNHPNLYLTFTPDGARNLSRKKLALMLGIKAARYPIVLNTTSAAIIDSDLWLAHMTAPFADPDIEVVIGRSTIDPDMDTAIGNRTRCFNGAADNLVWLNAAISGHPYRGSELNLAYTRRIFFDNRGFSRSLNLHYGDDDIFVSEIARPGNTATVTHPDATVRRNIHNGPRAYRELRRRYDFTGRFVTRAPRRLHAIGAWTIWIIIALSVAGAIVMLPNMLGAAIGALIILGTIITATIMWRRAVTALTGRRLLLTLPWLILTRPFDNIVRTIRSNRNRSRNYTWI